MSDHSPQKTQVSDPLRYGVRVDAESCVWPRRNPAVKPKYWVSTPRRVGSGWPVMENAQSANEAARVAALQTLVNREAQRDAPVSWPVDLRTRMGWLELERVRQRFQSALSGDNS